MFSPAAKFLTRKTKGVGVGLSGPTISGAWAEPVFNTAAMFLTRKTKGAGVGAAAPTFPAPGRSPC